MVGAGGGNRTLVASLEGWNSTIELHPRRARTYPEPGRGATADAMAGCPTTQLASLTLPNSVIRRSGEPVMTEAGIRSAGRQAPRTCWLPSLVGQAAVTSCRRKLTDSRQARRGYRCRGARRSGELAAPGGHMLTPTGEKSFAAAYCASSSSERSASISLMTHAARGQNSAPC